jgi:hypothetical protein
MRRLLLPFVLVLVLGACGTEPEAGLSAAHEDAQSGDCHLEGTTCFSLMLGGLVDNPQSVELYVIRRVGNTDVVDRHTTIPTPNITEDKEYTFTLRGVTDPFRLAVFFGLLRTRWDGAASELSDPAPTAPQPMSVPDFTIDRSRRGLHNFDHLHGANRGSVPVELHTRPVSTPERHHTEDLVRSSSRSKRCWRSDVLEPGGNLGSVELYPCE